MNKNFHTGGVPEILLLWYFVLGAFAVCVLLGEVLLQSHAKSRFAAFHRGWEGVLDQL